MLKYLRIAVTALSLTACVLLIALWVRSQSTADSLNWHYGAGVGINSFDGQIELMFDSGITDFPNTKQGITYEAFPDLVWEWPEPTTWTFAVSAGAPGVYFLRMPHLLPGLLMSLMAIVPWIKWHYRLRTLLIATTLVAAGLGMVIYLQG